MASKQTLIVALKRAVKEISNGIVVELNVPRTKEITLDNNIQRFCTELNGKFFQMKIRLKDWA